MAPSAQPADSIVTGEGDNLSAAATCTDRAGNSTTRAVTGIEIDRHAPVTGISGPSNDWVNGDVAVTLTPTDTLSGVTDTEYAVDGGSFTSGTSVTLSTGGDHTVSFYSVDTAGNGVVVWVRSDGTNDILQSATRLAGAGDWLPIVNLTPPGGDAFTPQVMLAGGRGIATFVRSSGSQWFWSVARYGVGPLIVVLKNGGYRIMDQLAALQGGAPAWPLFGAVDTLADP